MRSPSWLHSTPCDNPSWSLFLLSLIFTPAALCWWWAKNNNNKTNSIFLAQAVSAKLEDGNLTAAVRNLSLDVRVRYNLQRNLFGRDGWPTRCLSGLNLFSFRGTSSPRGVIIPAGKSGAADGMSPQQLKLPFTQPVVIFKHSLQTNR